MSLLENCKVCWETKALSEYHWFWYKWSLYTRKVCKICYRKQQNLNNLCERIRKESEEIARQHKRNLIKIAIKVLVWLVIVGWIVAVTAKC
jgi:predicted amidophosphoribosyltransferase